MEAHYKLPGLFTSIPNTDIIKAAEKKRVTAGINSRMQFGKRESEMETMDPWRIKCEQLEYLA